MDTVEEPIASSRIRESRTRTPAYASFDSNTDKLSHLFKTNVGREPRECVSQEGFVIHRWRYREAASTQPLCGEYSQF